LHLQPEAYQWRDGALHAEPSTGDRQ
jgi:hypothetical protein